MRGVRQLRSPAPRRLQSVCQAEVEHLHRAVRPDNDIGRFEIAMDDAARVRRRERISDRDGDAQHLAKAHAVARDEASRLLPRTYSITMKSMPSADSIS